MLDLISVLALCAFMVVSTTLLYYEILRFTWKKIPDLRVRTRLRVVFVVLAIFAGHTIVVWFYAAVYWLLAKVAVLGEFLTGFGLEGVHDGSFESLLYFSASTYSSLGFGDIVPTGPLRILTGVEVLNGLVLIGWSVSFTYLAMEKFWVLHRGKQPTKD